jgi:hypothetical protein
MKFFSAMKGTSIFSALICFLVTTQTSWSENKDYHLGFRVAPRISTLGGGLEVAKGITPWFGLRGGVNYFTWNYETTESGNDYDVDLELKSFGLFADFHPFKQAFRVSLGFLINGNGVDGTAKLGQGEKLEVNGNEYFLVNDSALMKLTYNTFAPYAGIGWDTTFGDDDRWGFVFDLGVVFSGSPELALNAAVDSAVPSVIDQFEKDKTKEITDLQDDFNDFQFWPLLSAGIVYQF